MKRKEWWPGSKVILTAEDGINYMVAGNVCVCISALILALRVFMYKINIYHFSKIKVKISKFLKKYFAYMFTILLLSLGF